MSQELEAALKEVQEAKAATVVAMRLEQRCENSLSRAKVTRIDAEHRLTSAQRRLISVAGGVITYDDTLPDGEPRGEMLCR